MPSSCQYLSPLVVVLAAHFENRKFHSPFGTVQWTLLDANRNLSLVD